MQPQTYKPPLRRRLRDAMKHLYFHGYKLGVRLGVHVMPVHYYCSLPNIVELERTRDLWAKPSSMHGVRVDLDEQMENLRRVCTPFQEEFAGNRHYVHAINQPFPRGRSRFFGYIEAQVLHAAIRHYQPNRVIEIGGGVPSYCTAQAVAMNGHGRVICIEPDPVDMIKDGKLGPYYELINKHVRAVSLDLFEQLQPNDIVSIDSDHVVKTGGEVSWIVLEILPRLPPGVLVQMHDIYLPYEYDRDTLNDFLLTNETALVAAFLACNTKYEILFALSMLHYGRKQALQSVLPEYNSELDLLGMRVGEFDRARHFPSSLWLRVQR